MRRDAVLSECQTYRYSLTRSWGHGDQLTFVLLNPSTADAQADDQTVRRCIGYARREQCTSVEIVNLFALRSTDPAGLTTHPDPIGPENDVHLARAIRRSGDAGRPVVIAWSGLAPSLRVQMVLSGPLANMELHCLGLTRQGAPRHPSRGRYQELTAWTPT